MKKLNQTINDLTKELDHLEVKQSIYWDNRRATDITKLCIKLDALNFALECITGISKEEVVIQDSDYLITSMP